MKNRNLFITSIILFTVFVFFTILVAFVDVKAIGVVGSGEKAEVGFSLLNGAYKDLVGYTEVLYKITDWASIATIPIGIVYFVMGLKQWIKRKNLLKVDASILILGLTYIALLLFYLIFQMVIKINYRPVLVDGGTVPEVSYPSSTTLLAIGFMGTSIYQTNRLIKNERLRKAVEISSLIYMAFLVIGRAVSGVHWLTDIIGNFILGLFVVVLYIACSNYFESKQK